MFDGYHRKAGQKGTNFFVSSNLSRLKRVPCLTIQLIA
jgi:hypothetical protein